MKSEAIRIALAGNPNVGKSTVFNELTGMKQHTGNWAGKTVENAEGRYTFNGQSYIVTDIPGAYSLNAHSKDEEVASHYICFSEAELIVAVCDATCLERNLNLVLQILETGKKVLVCVNLLDEAEKQGVEVDVKKLESLLKVPVVGTAARSRRGLLKLMERIEEHVRHGCPESRPIDYGKKAEEEIARLEGLIPSFPPCLSKRFLAIKLLQNDRGFIQKAEELIGTPLPAPLFFMKKQDFTFEAYQKAEEVAAACVKTTERKERVAAGKFDRLLTGKWTGIPIMLLLLGLTFYITITAANYPSALLAKALFWVQDRLSDLFRLLTFPPWLHDILVLGAYRTLAWVVAVMLPPMAIFFPLFTLLEDLGVLPRIAFNLDNLFMRCSACGKQSLTMCMGLGCNAAGVVGCRIIDSRRERLIAILTNNFVPCNGRFPTLITLISVFFSGSVGGVQGALLGALMLMGLILFGILVTFFSSFLLSKTVLKGVPSSFTLELPPFRKPQILKVIYRSFFDRTLFVLGRAAAVAAPTGALIWLLANVQAGGASLLTHIAGFFDPFARLFGLDGVIFCAFILGLPANEIVLPVAIMAYSKAGVLTEFSSMLEINVLLKSNGWTALTALCVMVFSLLHWPCSTTLLTIQKETGSFKWTLLSFLLPTLLGLLCCALLNLIF